MLQDNETIAIFATMKRRILTYGGYFEAFMQSLKENEQKKSSTVCCF